MLDVFITSRVRRKILVVFAKYQDFKQFPLLRELQSMVIKSQQYSNQKNQSKTIG